MGQDQSTGGDAAAPPAAVPGGSRHVPHRRSSSPSSSSSDIPFAASPSQSRVQTRSHLRYPSTNEPSQTQSPPLATSATPRSLTERVMALMQMSSASPVPKRHDTNLLPIAFTWHHGGSEVLVTGSFVNWNQHVPMLRNDDAHSFTRVLSLPPGVYEYRFLVDGAWQVDPNLPTAVSGEDGQPVNVIEILSNEEHGTRSRSPSVSLAETDPDEEAAGGAEPHEYGQRVPLDDELAHEAPVNVPPHFGDILLNSTIRPVDPCLLPTPNWNVTMNHLYTYKSSAPDVVVLGVTQRCRTKFVTTVYYKPAT